MKLSFTKFPIDLILCFVWSGILTPLALLNIETPMRLVLGIPFILFIPGYVLVFALFPFKKKENGINIIERIGLSLGASISVVPLIGLALNFTPWGIRLEPILLLLILFIFSVGLIAVYRWFRTTPADRFFISIDMLFPSFENRFNAALTLVLITLIIISITLLLYVILVPNVGEKFTEFYVLGPQGKADGYPQNLSVGENASVILGIANHEYRKINYTIEVWLINQTLSYNTTQEKNETVINHLWFIDKISVELNHTSVDLETPGESQWEYNYTFSIPRNGSYKLAFLLFTNNDNIQYIQNEDYREIANESVNTAYREIHLWITVQ